jgi:hypothetical protein
MAWDWTLNCPIRCTMNSDLGLEPDQGERNDGTADSDSVESGQLFTKWVGEPLLRRRTTRIQ